MAITSTAAAHSERQDSAQRHICVLLSSGPAPTLAETLGHWRKARCFFPSVQWALHQERKNMFYIYTTKLLYLHCYFESLSHWWILLFAIIKHWAVCQVGDWCLVSLLATWLWFVINNWLPASMSNGTGGSILCRQRWKWSNNTFRVCNKGRCFCYLSNFVFCDLREDLDCSVLQPVTWGLLGSVLKGMLLNWPSRYEVH